MTGKIEPQLVRVEPKEGEIKRYEVHFPGKLLGHVVQMEDRITMRIPYRGRHLSKNGVTRPFWFFSTPERGINYRMKQETRKGAVAFLLPR